MGINYSDIHDVSWLIDNNKTIALLKKDNAPLIISFLFSVFKNQNTSTYYNSELTNKLADFLYYINLEGEKYPGTAKKYLENWTNEGFLRQYYGSQNDESLFELTPATENALRWLTELNKTEFVGTESRLLNIFNILREIALKSSDNKENRIRDLENQKKQIELEIEKIKAGEIDVFDSTKIKERFTLLAETTSKLLSDFRQVEDNFRELNRQAREEQIKSNLSKGKLLDNTFKSLDLIEETDQGKSFRAFWEFLMDPDKQDDLEDLIQKVISLPDVKEINNSNNLQRLKINLVESGDKVNRTNGLLIEQLRKFLDSKFFLENRRIADIIKEIENIAIDVKEKPPQKKVFFEIDDKPKIEAVMERPLFVPTKVAEINSVNIEEGESEGDASLLFEQLYINPEELRARIKLLLRDRPQISLKEILFHFPVEKGLTEIVTYFSLASYYEKENKAIINDASPEVIEYENKGQITQITLPQTLFTK